MSFALYSKTKRELKKLNDFYIYCNFALKHIAFENEGIKRFPLKILQTSPPSSNNENVQIYLVQLFRSRKFTQTHLTVMMM